VTHREHQYGDMLVATWTMHVSKTTLYTSMYYCLKIADVFRISSHRCQWIM